MVFSLITAILKAPSQGSIDIYDLHASLYNLPTTYFVTHLTPYTSELFEQEHSTVSGPRAFYFVNFNIHVSFLLPLTESNAVCLTENHFYFLTCKFFLIH